MAEKGKKYPSVDQEILYEVWECMLQSELGLGSDEALTIVDAFLDKKKGMRQYRDFQPGGAQRQNLLNRLDTLFNITRKIVDDKVDGSGEGSRAEGKAWKKNSNR